MVLIMKKARLLFVVAIIIVLSSCNKDKNVVTFIATTEGYTDDKTLLERHYDDSGNEYFAIKWEIGDQINVYYIAGDTWPMYESYSIEGVSQDGRTAYVYSDGWYGGAINPIAVYGHIGHSYYSDIDLEYGGYFTNTNCPSLIYLYPNQSYSETNIINGFPMVSQVHVDEYSYSHVHLSFYNICGLLRITIKDGRNNITRVKKVRISSSNALSGSFRLGNDTFDAISIPEGLVLFPYSYSGGDYPSGWNYNYIELSCSHANNSVGVPLAIDGTDFYFYVPPTSMNDMVIEVTNMDDEVATKNLSGHSIQVMRSQLTGIKVDFTDVPFI